MSENAFIPSYKSKKEITVSTSPSALTGITNMTGRMQLRIANYSSGRVAYSFDGTAADITKDPTLPAGAVEIITVHGKGGAVVCSVQGAVGDGVFEITQGAGT